MSNEVAAPTVKGGQASPLRILLPVIVLAVGALSWWFVPSIAGFVGGMFWGLLLLVPSVAERKIAVEPDLDPAAAALADVATQFDRERRREGNGSGSAGIVVSHRHAADAVGDWASTALFRGRWQADQPLVERIFEIPFPNSLGLVYSAFTAFLGFNPNDSECSTMALAAFGRPVYVDAVRAMVAELDDGTYRVDQSYFNFANFYKGVVTGRFTSLFGEPRAFGQKLPGVMPPTSYWCRTFVIQQKSLPSQKTGFSSVTSIWCAAPTQGSFERNMSPSKMPGLPLRYSRVHLTCTSDTPDM